MAERTELVYDYAMKQPVLNPYNRIKAELCWGPVAGLYAMMGLMLEFLIICIVELLFPEPQVDISRNFNS